MSREFGSYDSGFFHTQIENAAGDLEGASDETSRVWAPFFRAFFPVAYAIASSEAGDSGEDASILETIKALPALQEALDAVKAHVAAYDAIAKAAVQAALKNRDK